MEVASTTLARNTGFFTIALIGQKVISFAYFTYLARIFGPEDVGRYVFALSFTAIFSVLLDLGLSTVLTRELARDRSSAEHFVRLIMGYKVAASLVVASAANIVIYMFGYPSLTRELVLLASIVMVLDSFTLSAYSAIRGFQTLVWESIGSVLVQLVMATFGVVVSLYTKDLRFFMAAVVVAAACNATYALWQLRFRFSVRLTPLYDATGFKKLALLAWPFAAAAILTRVYGYVDTIIISLLSGDRAVGIYSVAYKITFALQFIPTAFSASLLPGFSAYFVTDRSKLATTFVHGVSYLVAIATPISLGIVALAPEVVAHVYPGYHDSVLPLQVLMLSLPLLFASFPVGALLSACNRQKRHTLNIGIAAAVTILLNLLLVPELGPLGAAIASFASSCVLLGLGWVVMRQLISFDSGLLWRRFMGILAAGLVMYGFAMWTKFHLHYLLVAVLAAMVYLVLIVLCGGITLSELRQLPRLFIKKGESAN